MVGFSALVEDRLTAEYPPAEREGARALLATCTNGHGGPDPDRVRRAVLRLARGSLPKLESYVLEARRDPANVVYWAESVMPYLERNGRHAANGNGVTS